LVGEIQGLGFVSLERVGAHVPSHPIGDFPIPSRHLPTLKEKLKGLLFAGVERKGTP
jgi:hypothetical protein